MSFHWIIYSLNATHLYLYEWNFIQSSINQPSAYWICWSESPSGENQWIPVTCTVCPQTGSDKWSSTVLEILLCQVSHTVRGVDYLSNKIKLLFMYAKFRHRKIKPIRTQIFNIHRITVNSRIRNIIHRKLQNDKFSEDRQLSVLL